MIKSNGIFAIIGLASLLILDICSYIGQSDTYSKLNQPTRIAQVLHY